MQEPVSTKPDTQRPILIQVGGEPQGVVVPAPDGFRFLAVRFPVFAIDGHVFASVEDARLAASEAAKQVGVAS